MSNSEGDLNWYCVRSKVKRERVAASTLAQLEGVEVFCPHIRKRKRTRRGLCWFEDAMFPGYLFARFDFGKQFREVSYACGVTGIVHFGDRYAKLPDGLIDSLKTDMNSDETAVADEKLVEGDRVAVAEGAFSGLLAVVTGMSSGKDRVRVLLDFLGRQVDTELSSSNLIKE